MDAGDRPLRFGSSHDPDVDVTLPRSLVSREYHICHKRQGSMAVAKYSGRGQALCSEHYSNTWNRGVVVVEYLDR